MRQPRSTKVAAGLTHPSNLQRELLEPLSKPHALHVEPAGFARHPFAPKVVPIVGNLGRDSRSALRCSPSCFHAQLERIK